MTLGKKGAAGEIAQALLDLMEKKPFLEITVTEVVKQAGVSRASFYRNFSSTGEVLDLILDDLLNQFKENVLPVISSQDERKWREFLFRYIYFAADHNGKLILSRSSNISLILYRGADAARELSHSIPYQSVKEKYCISSRVGVINNVILRWLDEGKKETPEELVDYLMSFILLI